MKSRSWDGPLLDELARLPCRVAREHAIASDSTRVARIEVDTSAGAVALGGRDFGGLVRGSAAGVARPRSTEEISALVTFAGQHGLGLTPRGAGLSQSGQSIPRDGLVLDLGAMRAVARPDRERLSVRSQPGATWRDVLAATLPLGLAPKVTPLNLDLSVGGTLSAGGMGSTSHRHGFAVSNVLSADVVLGTGDVVRCGPQIERRVYDAVFGGVGRAGVIASVEHSLEPVAGRIRTFFLLYEDLETLLVDQRAVATRGGVQHLEAFCSASVQGLRLGAGGRRQPLRHWLYGLHLSVAHDGHDPPSSDAILEGLHFGRLLHTEDDELGAFLGRYQVRFDAMRATGGWEQAHPWLEALIPADSAGEIIRAALELPAFLGDGHRITLLAERDHPAAVAFPEKGPALVFAVLPVGVPEPLLDAALGALRALDERIQAVGGKRYLSGWLFDMGPDTWKAHYGAQYELLAALKRELDPANVLRSCLPSL